MSGLLGLLLPLGIGAAISPIPTAICLMLLGAGRNRLTNAVAFLVGSSAVLVAIGILALVFFGGGGTGTGSGKPSDIKDTIDAVIGVFLLLFAFKLWLKAPDPNAPPPRWMAAVDSLGPGKALLFGMMMTSLNFSSLPLYISGLKEIVTANVGIGTSILVLALFILLIEVGLLVPIASYALAPRRAGAVLDAALRWLEKNNRILSILLFAVFGAWLSIKGVTGLLG